MRTEITHVDPAYRTYADFYMRSAYGAFPQQHRHIQGSMRSSLILVEQSRHEFVDPAVDELVVSTPLDAACSYDWNMGSGWTSGQSRTGDLIIVPPGTDSRWRAGGDRRLIILAIPTALVSQLLGPDCPADLAATFAPLGGSSGNDAFVNAVLRRLWENSGEDEPINRSLADRLVEALVCHLVMRAGTVTPKLAPGPFSLREWRKLEDYVDAHLHRDILLLDLADIVGWSVRHFSRMFRQATGKTPHDWIVAKRVGRSKDLLGKEKLSLAEIALCCGFADQSHFTTSFRKATGMTPLRWRRGRV
ncbi:helix-turn-helix domain-containing protein [Mesorhizobium sp. NZP2298]|uniref:helix-turn-helix domain-containing protein n=1 Tax=Mesorhizobium sp. NZP2298 TaxID=2483403 RepID=UPI001552403D|nr:AraC family transcriptional regulator [Mesorhizobium sp. NZP2298]QKC98551.1 AraC family transcriptional regulator [Mesorhizobium sp. NZP2298]